MLDANIKAQLQGYLERLQRPDGTGDIILERHPTAG